jgi:predicted nucleotidyltransferase
MAAFERNLMLVQSVARALGPLREELVFVGGCAVGLLLTNVRAEVIRMTVDVDLIAEVSSVLGFRELEKRMAAQGFSHDLSRDAPICRWRKSELIVDVMPSHEGVLGFHNPWYPYAIESALLVNLPDRSAIKLISAPAFIGTKIEAFKNRGQGDYLGSHDLEDILTVVDGRETLLAEIYAAPSELQKYLARSFREWLSNMDFVQAIAGHLPPDFASQQRVGALIKTLRTIAST